MTILVIENNKKHNKKIPTRFLLNRLTVNYIYIKIKDETTITKKQLYTFLKILKKYYKENKGWNLLEVDTSEGEHIEIKL
jgi:hypothetical protein